MLLTESSRERDFSAIGSKEPQVFRFETRPHVGYRRILFENEHVSHRLAPCRSRGAAFESASTIKPLSLDVLVLDEGGSSAPVPPLPAGAES